MRALGSQTLARVDRNPDYVVTEAQAAQLIGVSDRALEDMRRRGASPDFLLLGRGANPAVLYREAAVLDWRNRLRSEQSSGLGVVDELGAASTGLTPASRPAPKEVLGDVYLSAVEVCRKIGGIGKSTLYLWIKKGIFPAGTRVGPRRTAWSTAAVDQWLRQQAAVNQSAV